MSIRNYLLALFLVSSPLVADDTMDAEIEQLINFVAQSGCDFERNGSVHDSESAAAHMRLKLRNGKRYVKKTEHFIDRLASESSWTGRKYHAICDCKRITSGDWLHAELKRIRSKDSDSAARENPA